MDKETNEIKEIFEMYENMALDPTTLSLIKTLKEWYFEKEKYKSRIDKAIKHIKEHNLCYQSQYGNTSGFDNHLLDILRGKDNGTKR